MSNKCWHSISLHCLAANCHAGRDGQRQTYGHFSLLVLSQGIDEDALNELFLKGENLLKRTPSGEKREAVREKHNLLHDKYDTLKVIIECADTYTIK